MTSRYLRSPLSALASPLVGPTAVLMAVLLALALAAPAEAAGRTVAQGRDVSPEPTGDVVRIDLDRNNAETGRSDAPDVRQGDIKRTIVKHTRSNVIVHMRAAELERTGYAVRLFVGFRTGSGDVRFLVQQARHLESFRPDDLMLSRPRDGEWRCDDARVRWRWGMDAISVRVPRSCLGDPRIVKAAPTITTRYATPEGSYLVADDSYDQGYKRKPSYGPWVRSR